MSFLPPKPGWPCYYLQGNLIIPHTPRSSKYFNTPEARGETVTVLGMVWWG